MRCLPRYLSIAHPRSRGQIQVSLSLPELLHKVSNKMYCLDRRTFGHKTELVLRHRGLSSKPSLNHSLPELHGMAKKLDTPIVVAHLCIAFVFEDRDDVTQSSLFRHLCACEDHVEEASKPTNTLTL
ncbi:hypothetical protein Tco_0893322 [Tanacetum coccineum]|uniref:Uncharacterized protein n=1 Tax=Tanacetum coccineum TaxID=301880 RepID=A0ABQ5C8I6_9ASTR